MLLVRGWCSTSCIDSTDYLIEPDAIRWPNFGGMSPPIELLYMHDDSRPAGRIRVLERRATPNGTLGLWIEASVHDAFKSAPFRGFSVGIKPTDYQIKQGPKGPYASVTSAILTEVSLAQNPANPECLIQSREEVVEVTPMLLQSINKARALQRLVEQALQHEKGKQR